MMKISITGKMKENQIQIGYRMFILSMIKKVLSNFDEKYFNNIFFYNCKKSKKIKPFTFSVFFRDYKMKEKLIKMKQYLKLYHLFILKIKMEKI